MKESTAVTEVVEEAETQTIMTDQVKEKILGVAAPVTAVAAAAGAAVVGFMSSGGNGGESKRETSPVPGTSPDTAVTEETEQATTAPIVDEVQKTDDEPVSGAIVPPTEKMETTEDTSADKHPLETVALGTDASATAEDEFAAALAADKQANTAPTYIPSSAQTLEAPPEKNESLGILPVPSETAPEGTKPLAKSAYKDPEETADAGSLTPEPVQTMPVTPSVPESSTSEFQPVTTTSDIISSAETTATTTSEQLKPTTVASSEDAAQSPAALTPESPTSPSVNPEETLSELTSGTGVTAIEIAKDKESDDTGPSRLVADKADEDKVAIEADAKAAHIEPAAASTLVDASVPTDDGAQDVTASGTEIVTEDGKESQDLKTESLSNGKAPFPEETLAQLQPPAIPEKVTTTEKGPPTPPKDSAPATPSKTPVSQSSAANKDKRVSGVPSESGSEKKKKRGFFKKLRKVFS